MCAKFWLTHCRTLPFLPYVHQAERGELETLKSERDAVLSSKSKGEKALRSEIETLEQEREQLQQSCAAYEQRCRQLEEEAEGHMSILSAKQEADAEARKQFLALQEELSAAKKSLQVWLRVGFVRSYTKGRRGWGWWGASRGSGRRRRKA